MTQEPQLFNPECGNLLRKIADVVHSHRRFLVCGHIRPDGDCIGSQMALYYLLKQMGKDVRLYNAGPILDFFLFMPGIELLSDRLDPSFDPEVCFCLDCGAINRIAEGFSPPGFVINMDHHKSNDMYGDINYVDARATAVGEQVFHLAAILDESLSPEMGTSIYLALLSDSGSFRYANTTPLTFAVAARAVAAGANPSRIAEQFYDNRTRESVALKAQVFSRMRFSCGGALVWGEITQNMYQDAGGEMNEPDGLVSEMRGIRGVWTSILFHEIPEGGIRAGLRSRGKMDVSVIAAEMGGGGHVNASGCFVRGDYAALRDRLLEIAERHVSAFVAGVETK
ncbi:MAG TPA: bifunctional oligoribonuclease/PAP phosphatase NrnA [Candidatus Sumerlaeota bacterium]|nr:bifunctional oligoribonuclease/PAP phosphatase NrnA [Candidatus Sumerlaeota bacterium]